MANLGLFFWRAEDAGAALAFVRDFISSLPRELGAMVAGLSAPPAPFVPAEHQGTPGYAVLIANWGSAEAHAEAIRPLHDLAPLFTFVTPIPYVALQQMLDESAPWGIRGYEKAVYLAEFSDAVIDAGIDALPLRKSPMSITPIFPLGGAFGDVGDDETAFGGSRSARWVYNIAAVAAEPEVLAADREWARQLSATLTPHAMEGVYVNFLNEPTDAGVQAAYGRTKYDRLATVKKTWDPDNVFHHNANIAPAA